MRQTTVAGQFYPQNPKSLKKELSRCFKDVAISEEPILGAVVPHAGYIYSGEVAAHAYARLPKADTYILFGPNHTGYGSAVALSQDSWTTPLGVIETDREIGKQLAGSIIDFDELAHHFEHSIEVQIPFLQYRFGNDFSILPICMGLQDEETAMEVGVEVARAVKATGKKVVFIASSDFTHYQPDSVAKEQDTYLIEAILDMDIPEFYRRREERSISACGFGPIASMLAATKELGASKASLIKYATSGDVSGDTSRVVGYAAITIE
ncbi:putative dioxygenase [Methanolobus tindarius DSM 2278]|uniref:MEMO1 family protein MettiDRAFT_2391 n=1 Tax=Methanolobus tindarius DSM 2278 TaxID=1090322 RepID=W9DYV3_METTI|nr:MEMO1 family protein [Methanolobus tindarius]ETA68902.1 putative dioxygenase [Methanolobus tindarius DSM 2278]